MIRNKISLKTVGLAFVLLILLATSVSAGSSSTTPVYNGSGSAKSGGTEASYKSGILLLPGSNYSFSATANKSSGTNVAYIKHKARNNSGDYSINESKGKNKRTATSKGSKTYAHPGSYAKASTSSDSATVTVKDK